MKSISTLMMWSLVFLVVSCASRKEGWFESDKKITLSAKELKDLKAKTEAAWDERHVKDRLMTALEGYEKLSRASENNYDYLTKLSRGYYFLADAHLDDMESKIKNWEIGTSWGEKAMATNPSFAAAMKKGEGVAPSLKHLNKDHVAAVYWTAANLGKWGKAQGLATVLKYKTQIKDMIEFVEKADPNFFAGAAHRYWGVYYAVAPSFAGGDLNKSKKYFDAVMKKYPGYLATPVLYARFYSTKKNNPEEFEAVLNKVIKSKIKKDQFYPENVMEIKKAKAFLNEKEDLF